MPVRGGLYARVLDFFQRVWNDRDELALADFVSPELIGKSAIQDDPDSFDLTKMDQFRRAILDAIPDAKFTVEHMVIEGDRTAVRYRIEGTHLGRGLGYPPSGKRVAMTAMAIGVWKDGQLVEAWNNFDQLALHRQIGVMN